MVRPVSVTVAGSLNVGCHCVVTVCASGVPDARTTVVGRRRIGSQVVVVTTPLKSVSEVTKPLASWVREAASVPPLPAGKEPPVTASAPFVVP
ncbi:hypothetical protein D3C86_1649030 [compost metagenome]